MSNAQTQILTMLVDELRDSYSSTDLVPAIDQALSELPPNERRSALRTIGNHWYQLGDNPEVLTELGLALAERGKIDPSMALTELLMSYGAASYQRQTREWEDHLVRRMAELRGLHRVISAANSTLDLDTSMQTVVETVAEVMGVEACSVYLFEKNADALILRATHGLNNAAVGQVRIQVGDGITGLAAREGRPVSIRDVSREQRFHYEPALGEDSFRSILAVPIVLFSAERFHIGSDRLQGVISIQTYGPRDFAPEEVNFVETVAGELAFFIVNAQLYQQTDEQRHQKVRELQSLQHVSKRIAEQLDLEEVLKLIVEKAVELARVNRADILRYDDEGTLQMAASFGGSHRDSVMGFIASAVREGRPLAVLNASTDSRFPDLAEMAVKEDFTSLFCMPLHARGRTIGAICLYTREPRHFDYEQVRLLATFADEAAIAIENARLYAESLRALTIKTTMLQEMHHRVRNNLQTISALLNMQLRRLPASESSSAALRDSIARIQAIAGVHNLLCREDVGITTVDAVARQICDSARVSLVSPDRPVRFQVIGESATVGSRDATVLAIVINELIANAMSHGLAREGGTVTVETTQTDDTIVVEVRDDGPSHDAPQEPSSGSGLGLHIIRTLVLEDLDGRFDLYRNDGWMHARVAFPRRLLVE